MGNSMKLEVDFSIFVSEYKKESLSIKEFAKALGIDYREAIKLLSSMGIDVIDYDFEDDMKFMDGFL